MYIDNMTVTSDCNAKHVTCGAFKWVCNMSTSSLAAFCPAAKVRPTIICKPRVVVLRWPSGRSRLQITVLHYASCNCSKLITASSLVTQRGSHHDEKKFTSAATR